MSIGCLRRVHGPDPKHRPPVKRLCGGVEVWQDSGRVAIDHSLLEEYVLNEAINFSENENLWRLHASEKDPSTATRLHALDAQRSELREQRERAQSAYVLGIMSEREAHAGVASVDAALAHFDEEANSLLRQPVLSEVLASGTLRKWRDWTPGRRRAFSRLLIARVEVGEWPEGTARTTFRKNGETDAEFIERQHDRPIGIVAERVKIVWQREA